MVKKIILVPLAVSLMAACGVWWFSNTIFPPTNNPIINKKLNSLKSGESITLADLFGVTAERLCWVNPSYAYYSNTNPGEKYVSHMLGAKVTQLPTDMGDEEGGNTYVFIRLSTDTVQTLKLGSQWQEYRDQTNTNWCANVKDGVIEKTKEDWKLSITNKEIYNLPK